MKMRLKRQGSLQITVIQILLFTTMLVLFVCILAETVPVPGSGQPSVSRLRHLYTAVFPFSGSPSSKVGFLQTGIKAYPVY